MDFYNATPFQQVLERICKLIHRLRSDMTKLQVLIKSTCISGPWSRTVAVAKAKLDRCERLTEEAQLEYQRFCQHWTTLQRDKSCRCPTCQAYNLYVDTLRNQLKSLISARVLVASEIARRTQQRAQTARVDSIIDSTDQSDDENDPPLPGPPADEQEPRLNRQEPDLAV